MAHGAGSCQHSRDFEVPFISQTGIVFHGDPTERVPLNVDTLIIHYCAVGKMKKIKRKRGVIEDRKKKEPIPDMSQVDFEDVVSILLGVPPEGEEITIPEDDEEALST